MTLPERLYYPLNKAAKKINKNMPENEHIDIDDLFHFFYIGQLEFCVRIHIDIKDDARMLFQRTVEVNNENYEYFINWLESPAFLPFTTQYSNLLFDYPYSDEFEIGVSKGWGITLVSINHYDFECGTLKKII